ncbi:MAG: Hsp70 family protein [Candidatus Sericytochromatia bacterium]
MKKYKIGLDFGTTNSILSYINTSNNLETFKYPGVSGTDYIPSCVSYDQNKDITRIGRDAFRIAGDKSTDFYKDLKMFLPRTEKESQKLGWHGNKNPEEVITDYLKKLLISDKRNNYSFKKEIGEIEGIVVSIPQAWLTRQANHLGRPKLEKILKENLKIPLIHLVSEPVAAAAYYSHWHKEQYNDFFDGNLLVCDMGGGTFDVTLCKLSKNKVEVIANDGNGLFELGKAGVYFDTQLLKIAYKRIEPNEPLKEGTPMFYELYKQLQEYKVDCSQHITDNIQTALLHPLYSKKLPIMESPIVCYMSEVEEAFFEVKKGIENVLDRFLRTNQAEDKLQIDGVIFVGGFNEFELTRHTIKHFLNRNKKLIKGEMKFIEEITSRMSAKAISYGATLIANDFVKVEELYPHTIGIVLEWREVKDTKKEIKLINQKEYIPLIKGNDKIRNYNQINFHNEYLLSFEAHPKLTLFVKPNMSKKIAEKELPKTLDIELPNFKKNNRWKVGMRLDESQIAYIVFVDEEKGIESKSYELGNILTEMFGLDGLIISND